MKTLKIPAFEPAFNSEGPEKTIALRKLTWGEKSIGLVVTFRDFEHWFSVSVGIHYPSTDSSVFDKLCEGVSLTTLHVNKMIHETLLDTIALLKRLPDRMTDSTALYNIPLQQRFEVLGLKPKEST